MELYIYFTIRTYVSSRYSSSIFENSHFSFQQTLKKLFFKCHTQDAVDREGEDGQKIWVTKASENKTLYEYINKTMYRDDRHTRTYKLPLPFTVS